MMDCKHQYYHRVNGKLLCARCGEPSPKRDAFAPLIEDKAAEKPEDKALSWPPEAKRLRGRPKGR